MKIMIFVLHNLRWKIKNIHRVDEYCHHLGRCVGGRLYKECYIFKPFFLEKVAEIISHLSSGEEPVVYVFSISLDKGDMDFFLGI